MATTGSNFEACTAGMMPATTPTKIQMISVQVILAMETYIGKSSALESMNDKAATKINPTIPPIIQRNAASKRNSVRITLFLPQWLSSNQFVQFVLSQ